VTGREAVRVVWVDSPTDLRRFEDRWIRQRHRAAGPRWRHRWRLLVRLVIGLALFPTCVVPAWIVWYLFRWATGSAVEALVITSALVVFAYGWAVCGVFYAMLLYLLDEMLGWIAWTDDVLADPEGIEPLPLVGVPEDLVRDGRDDWHPDPLRSVPTGRLTPLPVIPPGGRLADRLLYGQWLDTDATFPVLPPDGHPTPVSLTTLLWLDARGELPETRRATDVVTGWQALTDGPYAAAVCHDLVVVLLPPVELVEEQLPDGRRQLHDDEGPALRWADGSVQYALHGTEVPEDLFRGGWSVRRIRKEPDRELRRLAIERMGWARFIEDSHVNPIARAVDPANEGAVLELYAWPWVDCRVLMVRTGSPKAAGTLRTYAERVPATIADPVAAAAWHDGLPQGRSA